MGSAGIVLGSFEVCHCEVILTVFLQVGTLRELQRLYDALVESADTCRLDRYAVPEKTVR